MQKLVFPLLALVFALSAGGCTNRKSETANTLRWPARGGVKGLDPALADDRYSHAEVAKAYEGLLQYHYLKRPYQLVPHLAESMPEVGADKRTYTFKLKKGVLFHDDPCFKASNGRGREMTAEDFVYSFKRLADPKVGSTGWWIFDGRIEGLNQWREAAANAGAADYAAPVAGLKAVDRYTLRIRLVQPSHQFLYFLAMSFTSVVPREAVELYGKDFVSHAVGTGPYRLESFNGKSRIVWVRNPNYREESYPTEGEPGDREKGLLEDAGKRIPFADRIVVTVFEEDQPRWLNFLQGNLDYLEIPKDYIPQVLDEKGRLRKEYEAKGFALHKTAVLDVTHDAFNMEDPILGRNKLLRQALTLAVDPVAHAKLFYADQAIPSQSPIPPNLAGYDPDYRNPYARQDVEKAKELLAKAGYPGGKGLRPIEYITLTDTFYRQRGEFLAKAWAAIGVKVEFRSMLWPEFTASIKGKRAQMWNMGWYGDYPDAENFLQLFYSKNASPGPNDANYRNPEFDRLYERALTLPDGPERGALYSKMVKLLAEDCPWLWTGGVHRLANNLTPRWLRNFKRHGPDEGNFLKYLRVEAALKPK